MQFINCRCIAMLSDHVTQHLAHTFNSCPICVCIALGKFKFNFTESVSWVRGIMTTRCPAATSSVFGVLALDPPPPGGEKGATAIVCWARFEASNPWAMHFSLYPRPL